MYEDGTAQTYTLTNENYVMLGAVSTGAGDNDYNHDNYFMGRAIKTDLLSIQKAFHKTHVEVKQQLNAYEAEKSPETEDGPESGCTALIGLMEKDRIVIANAGDGQALLVYQDEGVYKTEMLTTPHRLDNQAEFNRIPTIYKTQGTPKRLREKNYQNAGKCAGLMMTRGLGGQAYEPHFICDPEVKIITNVQGKAIKDIRFPYVVLSTDGFWEHVTPQECITILQDNNYQSIYEKADALRRKALENGSLDNITVGIMRIGSSMGVFDGFGKFGIVAAKAAAENLQYNLFRKTISTALKIQIKGHDQLKAELKKLKYKLISDDIKINPMAWDECIQLAQGTQKMLDIVAGVGRHDHFEKLAAVQKFYDNYVSPPWWKKYSYTLTMIAFMALGAAIGAILGALLSGPLFPGGAIIGAVEGAAEGAAFAAVLGIGASLAPCSIHFAYRHCAIEAAACTAISNAKHYPKFCS